MHVGLLGPFTTAGVLAHLPPDHGLPRGTGGTPVTLLAEELLAQGHHVTVWSLSGEVTGLVGAEGERLRVRYVPWRADGRGRDQYVAERRWLARALAPDVADVDVLNAHWTYEYALAALAVPAARRPPLLVTSHDWAPTILRFQPDAYRVMRLVMAARVYLRRPALTVPSPYLGAVIRRGTGLRSAVVPNGLSLAQLGDGPRRPAGPGRDVLSVADGFADRKNTAALLQAVGSLRRDGHDVALTLVGSDHGPGQAAHRWAADRGLADGVEFLGRIGHGEVLQRMATADLLAHPAREESFGMVLIEAMAQGLPVLGGRRSGAVPWVLDGGRAGHLVDVTDPEGIAEGILHVLGDPDVAEALSDAGYRGVRARFTMPVVAEGYLEAYADTIGRAGR